MFLEVTLGSLGRFLYELLDAYQTINDFFSAGTKSVLRQVLAQPDKRISILRKFSHPGSLTLSDKFERLHADRSLALSHSDGTVDGFVKSLKFTFTIDMKLVKDGIYRGKQWLKLENCVGEPGISAVVFCEHTLFKKQVQTKDFSNHFISLCVFAQGCANYYAIQQDYERKVLSGISHALILLGRYSIAAVLDAHRCSPRAAAASNKSAFCPCISDGKVDIVLHARWLPVMCRWMQKVYYGGNQAPYLNNAYAYRLASKLSRTRCMHIPLHVISSVDLYGFSEVRD